MASRSAPSRRDCLLRLMKADTLQEELNMAAPKHTAQGVAIVAWSQRYTENPYDRGHTVCTPCGDPFWDLQDWDMVMEPIVERELLSYPLTTHCTACGVDILNMLADMAEGAQAEHREAQQKEHDDGSCRCAWDAH